ncbi:DUF2304 domain-containing protein [Devriesea agamarum]|uniref:DUF2304 domain-containing protein n=1 Tax=Devriesea agamarum TaxID=472569 RepID=UPI00071E13EE|nr:DUF2304 domain-containing protein [Devriesea agamarum]
MTSTLADQLLALGGPFAEYPTRVIITQILLVIGIVAITAWMLINRGAKQLAIRRLLIIAFACFAVLAVIFPGLTSAVAKFVGVGRGTDLLLYATVVVLLGFLALQEARTKNAEKRTTYLARHIALDEAEQPDVARTRCLADRPSPRTDEPGSSPTAS